jgi:hypothetical protein
MTPTELKAWLTANVQVGTTLQIKNTQGGLTRMQTVHVVRLGKGRFEVSAPGESGGTTFYYSGKNCFCPKGQTSIGAPA